MKITDVITEAASPAMKKAGKKPRSVDEDLTRRGFLRGLGARLWQVQQEVHWPDLMILTLFAKYMTNITP